jgi:hypothetical protein
VFSGVACTSVHYLLRTARKLRDLQNNKWLFLCELCLHWHTMGILMLTVLATACHGVPFALLRDGKYPLEAEWCADSFSSSCCSRHLPFSHLELFPRIMAYDWSWWEYRTVAITSMWWALKHNQQSSPLQVDPLQL